MGLIQRALDLLIRLTLSLALLAVATLPLVYFLGHQPQHRQVWADQLRVHQHRAEEIDRASEMRLSNIPLREQGKKVSQKLIDETFRLADYVSHHLTSQGWYVVRKDLEFKQPKSKKGKVGTKSTRGVVSSLVEQPVLKSVKEKVEAVVEMQDSKLRQKVWVVASINGPTPSQAYEIKQIMEDNPEYRVLVVSCYPARSKVIDIQSVPPPQPSGSEEGIEDKDDIVELSEETIKQEIANKTQQNKSQINDEGAGISRSSENLEKKDPPAKDSDGNNTSAQQPSSAKGDTTQPVQEERGSSQEPQSTNNNPNESSGLSQEVQEQKTQQEDSQKNSPPQSRPPEEEL